MKTKRLGIITPSNTNIEEDGKVAMYEEAPDRPRFRVSTNSRGRGLATWCFTYDTTFKDAWELNQQTGRNPMVYFFDLSRSHLVNECRLETILKALDTKKIRVRCPPGRPNAIKRKKEIRLKHPGWQVETGVATKGDQIPFIEIPEDSQLLTVVDWGWEI